MSTQLSAAQRMQLAHEQAQQQQGDGRRQGGGERVGGDEDGEGVLGQDGELLLLLLLLLPVSRNGGQHQHQHQWGAAALRAKQASTLSADGGREERCGWPSWATGRWSSRSSRRRWWKSRLPHPGSSRTSRRSRPSAPPSRATAASTSTSTSGERQPSAPSPTRPRRLLGAWVRRRQVRVRVRAGRREAARRRGTAAAAEPKRQVDVSDESAFPSLGAPVSRNGGQHQLGSAAAGPGPGPSGATGGGKAEGNGSAVTRTGKGCLYLCPT
jgi:hypothetical protein